MSIERMKDAVHYMRKAFDLCEATQQTEDMHQDAKTLAAIMQKELLPSMYLLDQSLKTFDANLPVLPYTESEINAHAFGWFKALELRSRRQREPLSSDTVKRLMHESGLIKWFNSDDCEYLSFCNVVNRFAVLVQDCKR